MVLAAVSPSPWWLHTSYLAVLISLALITSQPHITASSFLKPQSLFPGPWVTGCLVCSVLFKLVSQVQGLSAATIISWLSFVRAGHFCWKNLSQCVPSGCCAQQPVWSLRLFVSRSHRGSLASKPPSAQDPHPPHPLPLPLGLLCSGLCLALQRSFL